MVTAHSTTELEIVMMSMVVTPLATHDGAWELPYISGKNFKPIT